LYSGVELPAAADRALAMLARRPLSVAFGGEWPLPIDEPMSE
jgi:hypothetical protein